MHRKRSVDYRLILQVDQHFLQQVKLDVDSVQLIYYIDQINDHQKWKTVNPQYFFFQLQFRAQQYNRL